MSEHLNPLEHLDEMARMAKAFTDAAIPIPFKGMEKGVHPYGDYELYQRWSPDCNSLKIAKVREVKTPERGTPGSAGLDFFVPDDWPGIEYVPRGSSVMIGSGIYAKIPQGYALIACNKSSVATKMGLILGACVIDEDYQGEIIFHLINVGELFAEIKPGQKIVQMLLIPVNYATVQVVSDLNSLYTEITERANGGFGSTDKPKQ